MGSNNSRLNSGGEAIPYKIRPLLRRRYEEIKNRAKGVSIHGGNALSEEQLLKVKVDNDDNTQSIGSKEVKAVPVLPMKAEDHQQEIVVVRSPAEKLSKVVPMPETEVVEQEKMNHVYDESEIFVQTKEEQDDYSDKDEDDEIDRRVCPSSPSFKIYCTETQKIQEQESEDTTHQKSDSAENVECVACLKRPKERKVNKKSKFLAAKNLLKMKSCYHPRSTSIDVSQRTGLIAAKEAS